MNNKLVPFAFGEFLVRVVADEQGEPLFVAKDVALALDYTWSGISRIAHVPEEWRGVTSVVTPSGTQDMLCLTEQGLYFFLARSDKPKALPFQKWLAGEVLPALRKTGSYSTRSLQGTSSGPRLSLDDVPEDVRRLKPRIRENCLSLALQACRLTGVSEAEAIHALFIDYCRAVGGLPAIEAGEPSLNSIIREYAKTQLEYRSGNRLQATVVYKHFCRWWKQSQFAPTPSQRIFGRIMANIYEVRKSNQMYYMNVAVIDSLLL